MKKWFAPDTKKGDYVDKYFYLRGKGFSDKEASKMAKFGLSWGFK